MYRFVTRLSVFIALVLGLALPSAAQTELGSITGTLKDPQGAVLPGVTATAVNSNTNVTTTAVTNEAGVYLLSSLVTGKYRVTFNLAGFGPAARDLEVRSGDRVRVDVTLQVGAMTEEVRVTAETPLLETTTATRSTVLDQEKVENLPMSGRNPYSLAMTVSGVTWETTRQSISNRPFDNGGMDGLAINGGRSRSNEFLLDGAPNASREGGNAGSLAFVPPPDAVQEVRVSTNTYDAQFGRTGGGVIAVSIRSGTNAYRGTAYYYHRDASLNGNLYENIQRGIPKEDLFHYNPGGTFGGPVKLPKYNGTNRTFFFYGFEGLKSGIPVSAGQRAPTELERAGNFSQSGVTIYDPLTSVNGVPQPFPGNTIPSNRIDPVAQALLSYMATPNSDPDAQGNNFFPRGNSRFDTYTSGILRVDHNISSNHRFFVRYAHNGRRETRAKAGREEGALTDGYHHRWNNVFSADLTSTLGPALVSSLRGGWTRHRRLDISGAEDSGGFDSTTARFPVRAGQRAAAAVLSDSHQRLRRREYRTGRRAGWSGRRLLRPGDADADRGPAPAQVRRRVPVRHERDPESPGRGQHRQPAVLAQLHVAEADGYESRRCRRRQCVRVVHAGVHGEQLRDAEPDLPVADRVYRAVPAGRLAAVEPPDAERGVAVGLRGAHHRNGRPGERGVRPGRDRARLRGVPRIGAAGRAPRGPHVCRRRLLHARSEQLRTTRGLYVSGDAEAGHARRVRPDVSGLLDGSGDPDRLHPGVAVRRLARQQPHAVGPAGQPVPERPAPAGRIRARAGDGARHGNRLSHPRSARSRSSSSGRSARSTSCPGAACSTCSYIGSATRKIGINRPVNDLSREQILLGDAYLNELVPNPFRGLVPDGGARNTAPTIQRRELLRPYPQFAGITERLAPLGTLDYQAVQISWDKRLSDGVFFQVNYTGSRNTQAMAPLNQGEPLYEELTGTHRPHVLRLSGGWNMPDFDGPG